MMHAVFLDHTFLANSGILQNKTVFLIIFYWFPWLDLIKNSCQVDLACLSLTVRGFLLEKRSFIRLFSIKVVDLCFSLLGVVVVARFWAFAHKCIIVDWKVYIYIVAWVLHIQTIVLSVLASKFTSSIGYPQSWSKHDLVMNVLGLYYMFIL